MSAQIDGRSRGEFKFWIDGGMSYEQKSEFSTSRYKSHVKRSPLPRLRLHSLIPRSIGLVFAFLFTVTKKPFNFAEKAEGFHGYGPTP